MHIIFDKDGTLIDSESVWFEAYDRLLQPYGLRHTAERHGRLMGASADSCIAQLRAEFPQLRIAKSDLFAEFRVVRDERGIVPMPGAIELLTRLRDRGITLGLATSAKREDTNTELDALGWRHYFSAIVTADDVMHHKPHPEIYLRAAELLHAVPATCIAIEDGIHGVRSAHAAGMKTIFIRDERFRLPIPDEATQTVSSLTQLTLL